MVGLHFVLFHVTCNLFGADLPSPRQGEKFDLFLRAFLVANQHIATKREAVLSAFSIVTAVIYFQSSSSSLSISY